jgi:predicted NAD-dependent protein-ADP-ribosyltransferase YbiA (DUF1768 family)
MINKNNMSKDVINFFSSKKEYGSLSNFWTADVTVEGRIYESGEHCFHGEKYVRIGEKSTDPDRKRTLIEYGKMFSKPSIYTTPSIAKQKGGKKGLILTAEELDVWQNESVDVQYEICKWKKNNYKEVRDDLIKSENKILVHPAMRCSKDKIIGRFWEGRATVQNGEVVILGNNKLGNIWMELR